MYGEDIGTGTLTDVLVLHAKKIRDARDNGVPSDDEMLDDARMLMEGAMVLWMTIVEEVNE